MSLGASEFLSLLYTFENSSKKCIKISFNSDSFSELLQGLLTIMCLLQTCDVDNFILLLIVVANISKQFRYEGKDLVSKGVTTFGACYLVTDSKISLNQCSLRS